jgi:uncharacterized protein
MKLLEVRVKPGARESGLEQAADGHWLAKIKAAPIEGRANDELISLIARHFGLRRSQVSIRSGASGRLKRVQIDE